MPWIRVDDHYAEHPKLAAVGPLGQALWLAGLAYCNRNLTDGFIPWSIAGRLLSWDYLDGADPEPVRIYIGSPTYVHEDNAVTSDYVITVLVTRGVWDEVPNGYRIHDYEDYQPTKAQVLADRAAKQAAGRAGGQASALARGQATGAADAQAESNPNPKPVPNPNPGSVPRDSPLPPTSGGTRANGTNPRSLAEEARLSEREARRQEAMALHQRYLRGEITEAVYERMKLDIGKEPDDLTRYENKPEYAR